MLLEFQTLLNTLYTGCPINTKRLLGPYDYFGANDSEEGRRQTINYMDDVVAEEGETVIKQIKLHLLTGNLFKLSIEITTP